ncbi:aldo/keto reductase [Streptomyces sp. SB3404]|uniref:Aldo/keto reductase n=1 Tax=Streptomyces boncukensis TaxID=2711219 RepID=A0A6G4WX46_9ACTN|nr:aldo/keto reductase [Streptomyces boncukensis]
MPLGTSGVPVTRLSLGTAALGNLYAPVSEEQARGAVDAAWDAGIRYFDTAPHYGLGLSERRLGAALRDRPRAAYTLSTKVGRLLVPGGPGGRDAAGGFAVPADRRRVWDFSADGVRRSLAESLERLGLDRVDVVYLHDPDDHTRQALREGYPALERLRAEGAVGAIGVGMNQPGTPARFLRETDIDAVLLAGRYTLLDDGGARELLPQAAARGRAVVIGGVFNSGLLADPRPGAAFDYRPAPDAVLARALRLKEVTARHGVPLRAAALRFPLAHPAVACVLAGGRSAAEVRDARAMLDTPVPAALWEDLRAEGLLAWHLPTPEGAPGPDCP